MMCSGLVAVMMPGGVEFVTFDVALGGLLVSHNRLPRGGVAAKNTTIIAIQVVFDGPEAGGRVNSTGTGRV